MKNLGQKPFKVNLVQEGDYNRLYIKYSSIKNRIRKHIGIRSEEEKENIQFFLRYDLENHFANNEITREAVEEFEEYDNLEPEPDDIALTVQQVKRLIELKRQIAAGEIDLEANDFTDKIPAELQKLHFKMKRENMILSLDCFLFMISFGMYHSDIQKFKISILNDGDFKFLKYRRAKNGSLCKSIPIESDGIFIGDQIIKEYKLSTGEISH